MYNKLTVPGPYQSMVNMIKSEVKGLGHILEIGSGTGCISYQISPLVTSVTAIDSSTEMIRIARKKQENGVGDNIYFQQGDAVFLEFENRTFDAVIASNVLHLLPDPSSVFKEIERVVKKGGLVILPTYCHGENLLSRFVSCMMEVFGFQVINKWAVKGFAEFSRSQRLDVIKEIKLTGSIPLLYFSGRFHGSRRKITTKDIRALFMMLGQITLRSE